MNRALRGEASLSKVRFINLDRLLTNDWDVAEGSPAALERMTGVGHQATIAVGARPSRQQPLSLIQYRPTHLAFVRVVILTAVEVSTNSTALPPTMETKSFRSAREFRAWLEKNHAQANGLLLRIYKNNAGIATVTYAEALDQALCFGWIDGQKLPLDEKSWVQKFTPRRPKSGWSKKNTEHATRLIKSGAMTAAGLKQIDAAKADGRWKAAYDSQANASVPQEFLDALARNKKASGFYKTLSKTNLYSIAYRLQTAKRPETKAKRIELIVAMLARGETFH